MFCSTGEMHVRITIDSYIVVLINNSFGLPRFPLWEAFRIQCFSSILKLILIGFGGI